MDNSISVSVITYVKNGMPYIKECISSIQHQTLKNIEIIVVDAGSNDGTEEYIKDICILDDRIKCLTSMPSVGAQFNRALLEANGRYVAICEADDYILPNAYEKLFRIACDTECDVIRSDYYQFLSYEDQELRFYTHACSKRDFYGKKMELKDNFFLKEGVNGFWNGLYKRQFLIDHEIKMNETAGAAYQDMGFSFLCQYHAKTVYYFDEPFYCYRLDNPNASMNVRNRTSKMINEFSELKEILKKRNIWENCYKDFYEWEIQALEKSYISVQKEDKSEILDEIVHALENQLSSTVIHMKETEWQTKLRDKISHHDEEVKIAAQYFQRINNDNSTIVIFGAGFIGQVLAAVLDKIYKKEYLVTDNSVSIQSTDLFGHKILAPQYVAENYLEAVYLIANVNHAYEISDQLLNMGVEKEKIYICNNDDFLLRQVLMKKK